MSGFNWSFCLCHCNALCSPEKITAVPYSETHTFAIVCTFVGQDYTVPQLVSTALALEPCILWVTSVCWETTFGGWEKKKANKTNSLLKAVSCTVKWLLACMPCSSLFTYNDRNLEYKMEWFTSTYPLQLPCHRHLQQF